MNSVATLLAGIVLVFVTGFAFGFGVRARISARRRARAYRYRRLYFDSDEPTELDQTGPSLIPPEVDQEGPKSNVFTARTTGEK
jgi:hypothetical protein